MAMLFPLLLAITAAAGPYERRCGWIDNPTPGNWWLTDRDREWTLATQGGASVPGWDDAVIEQPREWVRTNGYYGYGCGCAEVRTRGDRVTAIRRLSGRPLAACRRDPKLERRK